MVETIKISARDFGPLLKELDIFNLLYRIEDSQNTANLVFKEVLMRLDDEKEVQGSDSLRRCVSRIDSKSSNQLLSS